MDFVQHRLAVRGLTSPEIVTGSDSTETASPRSSESRPDAPARRPGRIPGGTGKAHLAVDQPRQLERD